MEKLTFSKACKLLGVYDNKGRDFLRLEYEDITKNKTWLNINDWLWGKLQKMILETNGAAEIYWMMSQFVSRFEGKSGLQYDRLAIEARLKNDLYMLHSSSLERAANVIGDQECKHGREMNDLYFPLKGNFNPAELASKKCEKLSCLCIYSIVPKRDDKGRLIKKSSNK